MLGDSAIELNVAPGDPRRRLRSRDPEGAHISAAEPSEHIAVGGAASETAEHDPCGAFQPLEEVHGRARGILPDHKIDSRYPGVAPEIDADPLRRPGPRIPPGAAITIERP